MLSHFLLSTDNMKKKTSSYQISFLFLQEIPANKNVRHVSKQHNMKTKKVLHAINNK